ncbi:replication initiation protein RepC [uncultured Jannaschia sp.]|uniref:replication initiation protein RepC n=1 Tax=uncultured Jannaschia sp. TaxID=293347 RepID=UPI00263A1E2F|nr:replication initiation protein RepC [uncultured Jannaschia sp.]
MRDQSIQSLAKGPALPDRQANSDTVATLASRQRDGETPHEVRKAVLFKAARDAIYVGKIRGNLKNLLDTLIGHIPNDAPKPICPASAQFLGNKLGCKGRTLRDQIARLGKVGIVENLCLDNGRRYVERDRTGRIIDIAGIDLSPLYDQADELAYEAARKQDAYNDRLQLGRQVSRKRGIVRRILGAEQLPADLASIWTELPRRLEGLGIEALRLVVDKVDRIIAAISPNRQIDAARPADPGQQYITDQTNSDPCNQAIPAGKKEEPENRQPTKPATCGLENVSLPQVLRAAPQDWQVEMNLYGQPSWYTFAGVASERAKRLGIDPTAWAIAQGAIGAPGAAVIVMLGDAQSVERGGKVRSVGGWVRRMAERAEDGTAHLNRTLFGLLNKEAEPC